MGISWSVAFITLLCPITKYLTETTSKGKGLFCLMVSETSQPIITGKAWGWEWLCPVFVACYFYGTERRQKAQAGTRSRDVITFNGSSLVTHCQHPGPTPYRPHSLRACWLLNSTTKLETTIENVSQWQPQVQTLTAVGIRLGSLASSLSPG